MQDEPATNTAPDWTTRDTDLLCPLCEYNLRGLTESRCPECGFKFQWQELIDAEKNRHKYIFEHGGDHDFKSFWKTYFRTCQPRRFWNDLNPAQPVRLFRLLLYWILTTGTVFLFMSIPTMQMASDNFTARRASTATAVAYSTFYGNLHPRSYLDSYYPIPSQSRFWKLALGKTPAFGWAAIFITWPSLTLISLFIFRVSMRQAKIRTVHLVRTVIYSCDCGALLITAYLAFGLRLIDVGNGWLVLLAALFCAVVTTYRLTIAFRQYLRVHLPFATVLASQLIAFLIVFLVLIQLVDFSRRI